MWLKSPPLWRWIKYSSQPLDLLNIELWLTNCSWCCISFCRRSSITFRWEFECFVDTNVGLEAGRYSGTSRPDLYRTPQALQSVFGPIGPVRHCGVFSAAQCRHFRPDVVSGFAIVPSVFSGAVAWRSLVDQSHGVARERLLRALPGSVRASLWKKVVVFAFP